MNQEIITPVVYLMAVVGFILSIRWMNSPTTARAGVFAGSLAMLVAVIVTLASPEVVTWELIAIAIAVGTLASIPMALLMPMTAAPQRTALSHAFGSLAVMLVAIAKYYQHENSGFVLSAILFEALLGGITFTASLMAFLKLQELISGRSITYFGQKYMNVGVLLVGILLAAWHLTGNAPIWAFPVSILCALSFGILLIMPIGGADMPTVLALLNSYAGLSAAAMGFVLNNKLLIVAGALDGSSGFILAIIMCKAMNRSFTNVLFGAFGSDTNKQRTNLTEDRPIKSASPEEAAQILETAERVIIVPGYGMAVSQAQHKARELYDSLTQRGVDVRFAIHPVAGRMPGHMNVLLAEADIPYEKLIEMDEINGDFPQADVALVIGANDVTNPAAKHDRNSPIYGMPILNVDAAKTVMVIKRGMSAGFSGAENELYFMDQTLMLFGDAKSFLTEIIKELPKSLTAHTA